MTRVASKNCCYRETRNFHLGNELKFTENEYLPNFELKCIFFRKFEETTHTQNFDIDIDFERVSIVCVLVRLTKKENVLFLSVTLLF